jgi:hypothetical protein
MSRYRDQVAAALGAVAIRGPARYAWLGRPSRPLDPEVADALGEAGRRRFLVDGIRDELYCSFYRYGTPVAARWGEPEPAVADAGLVAALSRANAARGGWEDGWTLVRRAGGAAVVERGGLRVRVAAPDWRSGAGGAVRIRLPPELPARSPGFWTAVGGSPRAQHSVRVYLNVGAAGAPALVAELTAMLVAAAAPFRLKVADHPYRHDRCDAAVLYLPADAYQRLAASLRQLATGSAARLRPGVPAFTLPLAPGVGLAEEDGSKLSFGERRCALLAEAIVAAADHGEASVDAVAARMAAAGIDLDAPYREPSLAGRHVL